MVITEVVVEIVNVPLAVRFQSSLGTKAGTTRTVVRLRSDDGVEGFGETMRGKPVADLVRTLSPDLIGSDPFDIELLLSGLKMTPFFFGYIGYAAIAAIEMACFDLMGKRLGVPVASLIGGYFRREVPVTALATRAMVEGSSSVDLPIRLSEAIQPVIERYGFSTLKVKGSSDAQSDLAIMEAIRVAQPGLKLRIDPNGAWTVNETIRSASRLESLDLEYLEDPCGGLEGMARVRQKVRIPLCTNMCIVREAEFAPGVRLGAVDVIHGDVHKWGGIVANKRLAALCEAFGLGMNLHSGGELGISTACHLHLAAATPEIRYAIDSMYYLLQDDILGEPLRVSGGVMAVPTGPGLGVTIDEPKLRHYAAQNERDGDYPS